ncbi:sodium/potassium-transporting ATPase subunit beta-2-like [Macrosteles quadrilineatus]|uniref:sodium/potassium-transporting ATPase subunit beta-2-like n=1 Tax=Macrosteles quadrilineatus TaxID=74068 RepID=UPI0023E33D2A|nr:sodium/potassium-transporting ATPase subunit beta-2-like [Macrosteles quadrilineatus]XP_054283040.1 sodium/potassium-transporting ATPase subunit beta-2-like [Macrosteles quadrilineatus]
MSKDVGVHEPQPPGGYYVAPEKVSNWEGFKKFMYNQETGQVLGRTASSWGKIGAFYLIFYCVLASMFGIMLWIFYHTLDPRIPRWTLTESLIGRHPGLGFRPMPNDTDGRSTLIWYRGKDSKTFELWTKTLDEFLDVYRRPGLTPGRGQNIYNCDYDRPPGRGQVCDVDVKNWHPCISENQFNYHKSGPCVFVKLNKIYGWIPEYYNDTSTLPSDMPADLKAHINQQKSVNPLFLNTVWVTCEGEHPLDQENIGEIRYIPKQGFPGYFYPYVNTEGYLSPLVAIQFIRPKTGVIINVECKAWARNLIHDRKEKIGVVHFEVLID